MTENKCPSKKNECNIAIEKMQNLWYHTAIKKSCSRMSLRTSPKTGVVTEGNPLAGQPPRLDGNG